MALKPYWIKKYHLGMTGDEVKAALEGGGTKKTINILLEDAEFLQILSGTPVKKTISSSETINLDDEILPNVIITLTLEAGAVMYFNYALGFVTGGTWANVITSDSTVSLLQIIRNFADATNVVTISSLTLSST